MATPATDPSRLTRRGVLAAAASTLLLTACGRQERPGGRDTGPGADSREIVVGVSLELTGHGAALGVLQERALRITQETLNADGVPVGNLRRTVRLEIRDNASDPRLAARHATELAQQDGVHALVGGTLAETSVAVTAVAEQLQVPFVSLAFGDGVALPLSQRMHTFKLTPDAGDMAWRLARVIASERLRRVSLLAAPGMHGDSGVAALGLELPGVGVDLRRTVRLPQSGTDFLPAARRVLAGAPDGVVVWATAPDSGRAARELRRAGYRGRILFDAGAVAEDTLSGETVAAVEGAYVVHPISLDGSIRSNSIGNATLAHREFVSRYIRRHGGFTGFAPYASDALELTATAARLAGSVDRGRIRAYLQDQVTEGIAGAYVFTPIRHGGMDRNSLGVYTVHGGGWTRVA